MPHRLSDPVAIDVSKQYGDFRDQLFKDGYAVVKNAVPEEKCKEYVERMTQWLEKFPLGFDRNDPKTWTPQHLPAHMKGGMYHGYAVGHEKFVWDARLEPGVLAAFEKIWGTKELLASFDGINYTLPLPESDRKPSTPWPHVDQSPHLLGLQCIQGIINFAPNGPNDGGLVVLKGSQALCEQYFKCHSKDKKEKWGLVPDDWHGFDPEEVQWFKDRGAEEVKVCAAPGDLIVWDSRTVHWNVLPQSDQTRSIVYACYTPAAFATPEELKQKGKIFHNRTRTTHWPHRNFWHQDKILRFGKDDPYHRDRPFEEPEETEQLLKLAGAMPY
ncbi:hypothetical protein AC578_1140 [Pseudocercospora eumusae]|uniref:Phytanoyl-CoA dioxygenase n=1 Tax=Pseudocercospora eumusae TaxID=321146 RepID=A0A139HJI4_9PEZI|nr:hypothetical protein AC578_1140 [Pseudocercospora eumusae]